MTKKSDQFSIKIVGPAGSGVKSTGQLLQRSLQRLGFFTLGYLGYPSLIRGGQNSYQIDFAQREVEATKSTSNILLALNKSSLKAYQTTLEPGGLAIIDDGQINSGKQETKTSENETTFATITLPIQQTLVAHQLPIIVQNSFLVGAVLELLHYSSQPLNKLLRETFAKKKQSIIDANLQAVKLGVQAAQTMQLKSNQQTKTLVQLAPTSPHKQKKVSTLTLTGNDALALGFIKAGGQFYSAYPMTPSTNILHFLKQHGEREGLVVRQAATEIEAIGVAVGASYAGARSMVATSGGGLDLMSEFISMTATTETPLVIIDAQRTGSGTGLPTWTEQADLNAAKYTGHGEFPRIVIAPGDVLEAYALVQQALNLADEYQVPVILLSDKYLSESVFTLVQENLEQIKIPIKRGALVSKQLLKQDYLRYQLTETGISPRTVPGLEGGLHIANSDEHDEYGNSIEATSLDKDNQPIRIKMQTKRLQKLKTLKAKLPLPQVSGDKKAKIALVGWGSTKGVLEAVVKKINQATQEKQVKKQSKLALVHFTYLYPLDHQRLNHIFKTFDRVILVENNSMGQLKEDLLLAGANLTDMILKFDGEPFFTDELLEKVNHILSKT